MKVEINDLSSVKKKLEFELPGERIAEKMDKAFGRLRKKAKIKGFRPGKAPLPLVRRLYGDQVRMEAVEDLVQDAFSEAVREHELSPLVPPEIADLDFPEDNSRLSFAATIEVAPEFTLSGWDEIVLEQRPTAVEEAEVEAEMDKFRQAMGQLKTIDERPSREGDTLVIDFVGKLDGVEFEGGSADDFTIEIGSGQFIPDFERQLVGLEVEQSYDLPTVFPEDYHKEELAGKNTVFTVTVKSIREKELPEWDDDLAVQISGGELETLDQLREKISEYVAANKENSVKNLYTDELLSALRAKVNFELPECMVSDESENAVRNISNRYQSQGLGEEAINKLIAESREKIDGEAAKTVKNTLILDYISRQAKIECSPDEVGNRFQQLIQNTGENPQEVFERFKGRESELTGMLQRDVIMEKTVAHLLTKVSYRDADGNVVAAPAPEADAVPAQESETADKVNEESEQGADA